MKGKLHYWLIQLRRPLCFIAVLAVVAVYIVSYSAYAYVSSGTQDFITRFGIDTTSQNYVFYYRNGIAQYSASGKDSSKLTSIYNSPIRTGWGGSVGSWWFTWFDSWTYADSVTIDSVTYDLTNAYVIVDSADSWVDSNGRGVKFIVADGYVALADQYVVSQSPFHFIYADSGGTTRVVNVNAPETNGLYLLNLPSYAFGNQDYVMTFTDLDVFLSSSDGESGFTTLTTQSTDLDLTSSELFNFNSLKNDNIIINSGDPLPTVPGYGDYAKDKMNFSMTSYYMGGKNLNLAKQHITIRWPEVVRNHPQNFYINAAYTGRFKTSSMSQAVTFQYLIGGRDHQSLPVTQFLKNGSLQNSFDVYCSLNAFYDGNNKTLYDYFVEACAYKANTTVASVESNDIWQNFLTFVDETYDAIYGTADVDSMLAKLKPTITDYIEVMEITGYISLAYDEDEQGDDDFISGQNVSKFNFITGDSALVSSENTVNQYPSEGSDPYQLPSTGSSGDGSVTNNTNPNYIKVVVENTAREIMTPFVLEDGNVSTANVASNWNFMLHQLGDMNAENGFWEVIKGTYDSLPEGVTTMVYGAIAAILGCAVFRFYITCIRGA